jgi:hypothetical protein
VSKCNTVTSGTAVKLQINIEIISRAYMVMDCGNVTAPNIDNCYNISIFAT